MYQENYLKIEEIIKSYFDGLYQGDIQKLKVSFAENCHLHGDIRGVYYYKGFNDYLDAVKSRKSPNELAEILRMKIISIEIMNGIALVKLHVPMLGYNYYDFLSLALINGEWKIVHKLFTHVDT